MWYEINKCHGFKINNHNFLWTFILVTQIHNSLMDFGKMNSVM